MSDNNYKEIWVEALNQLRNQYKENGRENEFNLWFNLEYVSDQGNEITAAVASDFMLSQMTERGNIKTIKNKIKEISGIDIEIKFSVKNTSVLNEENKKEEEKPSKKAEKAVPTEKNAEEEIKKHPDLSENFTFETFVPGDNNMYAYQASMAAAKNPGKKYNPILLYGGSGLGKTHLMQSIGNYIYKEKKGKIKLAYINTESLMNEFTDSLQKQSPQKFKNKFRNVDVFLLDDIYFLEGKEGIQDEVFYIFEALYQKQGQMVFTCDRPINELKGIKERLRTRFSNGVCIDMQPPNYETRKAIFLKKLSLMDRTLNDEIIDFIAANIESDVRDLEGALKKVVGYADFMNKELTLDVAKQLLQENISSNLGGNVSIDTIQKIVADYYGISVQEIKSKKQSKKIAFPRHVAIYIARKLTEMSFTEIGSEFGGKDHSTIMSSCKKIEDQIKIDATLDNAIKNMIKDIKNKK